MGDGPTIQLKTAQLAAVRWALIAMELWWNAPQGGVIPAEYPGRRFQESMEEVPLPEARVPELNSNVLTLSNDYVMNEDLIHRICTEFVKLSLERLEAGEITVVVMGTIENQTDELARNMRRLYGAALRGVAA